MSIIDAAMVLGEHQLYTSLDHSEHCSCGAVILDHPTHQAQMLAKARLLAESSSPEANVRDHGGHMDVGRRAEGIYDD